MAIKPACFRDLFRCPSSPRRRNHVAREAIPNITISCLRDRSLYFGFLDERTASSGRPDRLQPLHLLRPCVKSPSILRILCANPGGAGFVVGVCTHLQLDVQEGWTIRIGFYRTQKTEQCVLSVTPHDEISCGILLTNRPP